MICDPFVVGSEGKKSERKWLLCDFMLIFVLSFGRMLCTNLKQLVQVS